MKLKLASLFCDNAVVQRHQFIPVWGWCTPEQKVFVTLGKDKACTLSNDAGLFIVRMPPQSSHTPFELNVRVGDESITCQNLRSGEVWVASGQSNMEWKLVQCLELYADFIRNFNNPDISVFTVKQSAQIGGASNVTGSWSLATPETAKDFSAVASFFANRLYEVLKVPVGIINASWGGTPIEAWSSYNVLSKNPEYGRFLEHYELDQQSLDFWSSFQASSNGSLISILPKDTGNKGLENGWHKREWDEKEWRTAELPQTWQNIGHDYSGVFWFRKEVTIPNEWLGKPLQINLGAIDKQDIVYVNGIEIGRTGREFEEQYWNQQRQYTLPATANTHNTVSIAVRVYSFIYDGGMIGPARSMKLYPQTDSASAIPLSGTWMYCVEANLGKVVSRNRLGHLSQHAPHILFDSMIRPLIPYSIRGAIWYQGEQNASMPENYLRKMKDLISDWRQHWGIGDFPFIITQLANFQPASPLQKNSKWAILRETQLKSTTLPNTGMAVTIDVGCGEDVHPHQKRPVGERLAQWALAKVYEQPMVAGSPLFTHCASEGNALRCFFENAGCGLTTSDAKPVHTLYVAGLDRVYHPATSVLEGATLLASSPQVPHPFSVCYAWADNPEGCNLTNKEGFPASPFRSDFQ